MTAVGPAGMARAAALPLAGLDAGTKSASYGSWDPASVTLPLSALASSSIKWDDACFAGGRNLVRVGVRC